MSKFFINRPIVAMVIAIFTVIVGAVVVVSLPVAQFPAIAPPEDSGHRRSTWAPTPRPSSNRWPRPSNSR